jgi:AraC-like DNA-binding protein
LTFDLDSVLLAEITYEVIRRATGGLTLYRLRRTSASAMLAAMAQTSPAHVERLFKHTPGLTPYQYVITCHTECAERLLSETDVPPMEIGLKVGCADQSRITALFRTHASLTPKGYRDNTKD